MIRTVWPLVVAAIALGIDAYVLAGVLPQIAGSLTTTVGAIGLGVTAFTGAYALAGPLLSGPLVAGSTRRGLLVALAVFNVGNLVTALAPNLGVFLGSRVVAGIGAGVLTAVATSAAAGMVTAEMRGRAMALVTLGLSAGTVMGVPLGMLIGQQFGWRWTMGLVVGVGLVSMLAIATRARPMPDIGGRGGTGLSSIIIPRVAAGVGVAFLFGVSSLGLYTYLLPMAADKGMAGWGFAFVWAWGIGGVTGAALVGRPIDVFGSRRLLPVIAGLLLASFVVLAFVDEPTAWLVAVLLWGACGWAVVPTLQDVLTRSRPERTTSLVAFQMSAIYLGSAVGSAAGSALLAVDLRAGQLPTWAAGVALLALLITPLVVARRRRRAPIAHAAPEESRAA
ncbi:MFS transporter [Spiractinospora alimapuensis]|uniref:MFS transporter n=1 Tax=Spiractinospora alimapuensis TaxID=2820884 RepID=UPI001F201BE9|nr:MFS transporter [Spiractinospora alimapuensis]QVQ51845.1 MFS transporter [Spiractinospora alimapuensis]